MKRGDLVAVAAPGDFGKPRPALVVQSDHMTEIETVTVLLITSTIISAPYISIDIEPSAENGLRKRSQIMIDKIMTVRRDKLSPPFGRVNAATLATVRRCLLLFLGLA